MLELTQGGNMQLGAGQLLVLAYNSCECVALNALHKQPLIHYKVSFLSLQPVTTCHPSSTHSPPAPPFPKSVLTWFSGCIF